MKYISALFTSILCMTIMPLNAATVVASVNGIPITDTDITARTTRMAKQGKTSTDNRRVALQNIIDDNVKTTYAANFNAVPEDSVVDKELNRISSRERMKKYRETH